MYSLWLRARRTTSGAQVNAIANAVIMHHVHARITFSRRSRRLNFGNWKYIIGNWKMEVWYWKVEIWKREYCMASVGHRKLERT